MGRDPIRNDGEGESQTAGPLLVAWQPRAYPLARFSLGFLEHMCPAGSALSTPWGCYTQSHQAPKKALGGMPEPPHPPTRQAGPVRPSPPSPAH